MRKLFTLLVIIGIGMHGFTQTTVFNDDFSTNTGTTVTTAGASGSSAWTILTGGTSGQDFGGRRNSSPAQLELTNDATVATNQNGWVLASTSTAAFTSPYNTTLNSTTGIITWTFNMRQIRPDPAGFGSGSYGVAYILAGASTTNNNTGTGYAVVLGQSGAVDSVRLVRYSAGIQGPLTNIIKSNTTGVTDIGTEYLSVKVAYTPSTNTWELFLRNDGSSAFADPAVGTLASQGTAADNTYANTPLGIMGAWWQGSTTAAQTAFFDNLKVIVTPYTPVITSISPTSKTAGDGDFTLTVNGTNFYNNSTVTWDGAPRVTTFIGSTQLTAAITAADISNPGSAAVGVTTPAVLPLTSNTQTFTIDAVTGAPVLSATALAGFGNVCINTTAGPNSFTLDGSNLNGSNIQINSLEGFTYSEGAAGTYTNALSLSYTGNSFTGKVIYVKFSPVIEQSYNGNINLNGGGVTSYDVPATGSGVNTPASATTIGSSSVTATTATLAGAVDAGCTSITRYGFEYSLNTGFVNGTGTQVDASNVSGGNFSATLTGLTPNQQYFYKAYAENSGGITYGIQRSFITTPLPVPMASQTDLTYTEDFHDIANWTNFFIAGDGANHFDGLSATGSGGIPNGTTLTTSTNSFVGAASLSSGGVQKGTDQATPTQSIVLLSTGGTDNSSSAAIDLYLDFTGVNAGTLSFDWASVNNSSGNRNGSMRVYASTNGTSFTEIASAAVLNFTNNIPTGGSISNIALPASFNNSAAARLRFYYYNGTGGVITPPETSVSGSRPKLSIDNLTVTSVPSTPCSTPAAQPTAMVFGTKTDVSIQGSFTAASPASDQYLTVVSNNSTLTSGPVDGTTYNTGDALGDGTVIAKGSALNFTATGLSPATTYYFFTYAMNGVCTGGPLYLTADPLTASTATNAALPPCAAPATQPANLVFGNATTNTIQGSFTAAAADEYLVLVSTSASLTADPVNSQAYNAGDIIGNASVVQRNASTSFTAQGLHHTTQYYFYIFSAGNLNCVNGPAYNTAFPLTGTSSTQALPPCTTPSAQPKTLSLTAANTSISGTFNASNTADDYLVVRSTSATLSSSPADTADYAVGSSVGGGVVISNSASTSFATNNLSQGTTYYFFVFAANANCSGGTRYLTVNPLTGSATTSAIAQNNYYFGSLHSHSDYSDGNKDHPGYTPALDYDFARTALCMDFLGISEHNHFSSNDNPGNTITNYHKGPVQADSFSNVHPNFLALYGMEWGVINNGGHVVIYGDGMDKLYGWESGSGAWGPANNYDVFVPKSVYTGPAGLFKTINNDSAYNTFATLAHPNSSDFNNIANLPYDAVTDNAVVGSAVESGPAFSTNTTYSDPGSSMSYLWYYQTMLSKGYHLGPTIDHDNHNTTFGKTASTRTAVLAPALTKTDVVKAMRDMHFYATEDCDSKVDFTINTRIMGSVFSGRNAPVISVTLTDLSTSTSSALIKIMSGKPGSGLMPVKIDSVIGNTLYFVDNNLANGETAYYYADITNGTARIVTSPIWYKRTCSIESEATVYSCESYEWNGQTYTESGTYSKTGMTSTGGCDSTAILHLTITTPTTGDTTVIACDSYTWYGTTYTSSGTPTHVLKERGGCDSTVTLHLTINHSSTSSETQKACDSYTWHGTEYTATGVYTFQSANAEGCTNTDTLHLTIEDNEDPTITAPSNVSVNADNGTCSATNVSLGTPVTNDNCGVANVSNDAPSGFPVGTTTVTWTVTDTHGRTATAAQAVTVTDNQDPTITAPSNVSVNADNGSCVATNVSLGTPATNDNCGVASTTNDAPPGYPVGTTTVTWTVTDSHGRTATAIQTVTVTDNQNPTITCIDGQTRLVNNAACTYKVSGNEFDPSAFADNCPGATVSNNFNHGNTLANAVFPKGTTVVVWTVTDAHGNTAACSTTVNVNSTLASSIPDVFAVQPGGAANTIYIGYGPSSVTLNAMVTGGTAPYVYKWTIGSNAGPGLSTASSYTVSPATATTYYLNVKDAYGCTVVYATKTIEVVDVRCGPKLDKVTVCVYNKGKYTTTCVTSNSVSGYLDKGSLLGACNDQLIASHARTTAGTGVAVNPAIQIAAFNITVTPNPAAFNFRLQVESNSDQHISIRVVDAVGRVITTFNNIQKNAPVTFGDNYKGGIYFAEISQGANRKTVKLIKL